MKEVIIELLGKVNPKYNRAIYNVVLHCYLKD